MDSNITENQVGDYTVVGSYAVVSAALAVMVYDTCLTLDREVKHVWGHNRIRLGNLLYIMARYSLIGMLICNIIAVKASNCVSLVMAIFQGMSFLGSQGLLVARTYAVTQGSPTAFAVLAVLTLLNLGALLVEDVSQSCSGTVNLTTKAANIVENFQFAVTLIFESVTIVVTFYCTQRAFIQRKLLWAGSGEKSLTSLLLIQGIHRYVIIFTWTLIDEIGSQKIPFFRKATDAPLENAVSTILICRIVLELRDFSHRSTNPSTTVASLSTWRFRTAILEDLGDDLSLCMRSPTHIQINEVEDTKDVGTIVSVGEIPCDDGSIRDGLL